MPALATIAVVVTILGGGGILGWWRATKPGRERSAAVADAILGSPPVHDRAGGIIKEGEPGLVDRTTTLEKAVALLVNQDARLTHIEGRVDRLEVAEEARREIGQESAAMWRAVANKDVIDVEADE